MVFYTYLPIQLDATCNGFQHMALLSNQERLFKQLNLVTKGESDSVNPKDFYNFLLHKLINLFDNKLILGEIIDNKSQGSYERLFNFV